MPRSRPPLMVFLLVLAVLSPSAVAAQEQQPFTVDDLLNLASLRVNHMTDDGSLLVGSVSRRRARLGNDYTRYGDPTYLSPGTSEIVLIDGNTGERTALFDEPVQIAASALSPDQAHLAFFLREGDDWTLQVCELARRRTRPIRLRTEKEIASGSTLRWLPDGSGLLIQLRADGWRERARQAFLDLTEGPIIVHDSRQPFLRWDELRNLNSLTIPAIVSLDRGEVTELLPEGNYGSLRLAEDGTLLSFTENFPLETVYARSGGTEYELSWLDLENNERTVLRPRGTERIRVTWNEAGDTYAWTDEGDVLVRAVRDTTVRNLTADGRPYATGDDTTRVRFSVMRFHSGGNRLLLSGGEAWWLADLEQGSVEKIWAFEGEEEDRPRLSVVDWSPCGRWLYLSTSARDRWERGLVRFDVQAGEMTDLLRNSDRFGSWRMTEDGRTFFFTRSDGDHPDDLWRADKDFSEPRRLTDLNPWIRNRTLTRSELVTYRDTDGEELYGILYYPVNYEPGRRYPLVCEIYETFFENGFNSNMNLIANAGYFGFRPSVHLVEGYPGEAWVKGVTAGINMLIERGLVDEEKLGVHGTSYGGYATALLVTQTPRFAAAINISGKVNMVSFYGDSPRLGIRNIQAPEWGQDRIGGSLWEYPERYQMHSAVVFADRIQTPLMCITGDLDYNVPARQSMEMYYAMRRLGKEVVWVRYADGGHSPPNSVEEYHDFWNRILGWYAEHFEKPEEEKDER